MASILKPGQTDAYYLKIARYIHRRGHHRHRAGTRVLSIRLLQCPGAFTAAVTPPLVVALLFAILWPGFTPWAAVATLGGGFACVLFSVFVPEVIDPFSHGVSRFMEDGREVQRQGA